MDLAENLCMKPLSLSHPSQLISTMAICTLPSPAQHLRRESADWITTHPCRYCTPLLYYCTPLLYNCTTVRLFCTTAPLQAAPDLVLRSDPAHLMRPLSLTFHDDKLWWSDTRGSTGRIESYDLRTKTFELLEDHLEGGVLIKMMSSDLQPADPGNGCEVEVSPCEELCLYVGSVTCQCSTRQEYSKLRSS